MRTIDQVNDAVSREGWALFECSGYRATEGELQAQRFDCPDWDETIGYVPAPGIPESWRDDSDVWMHLVGRANDGSTIHQEALLLLAIHSPEELTLILGHQAERQLTQGA